MFLGVKERNITAQKMKFPIKASSVNVTKSAVSCRFGHIYWRNPLWKTSFFVQCIGIKWINLHWVKRYGVSLRIQSECGKMRARITPNKDTFHAELSN